MLPPSSPPDPTKAAGGNRSSSHIQKVLSARNALDDGKPTKDAHGGLTAAVKTLKLSKRARNPSPSKLAGPKGIAGHLPPPKKDDYEQDTTARASSPQLISLGESPPTQPSSCEDKSASFGWTTPEQKSTLNGLAPALSSPTADSRQRSLSYHSVSNETPVQEEAPSTRALSAKRPSSMYSHVSQNARFRGQGSLTHQPHLPHFDQPHFYGAPDVDILLSPKRSGLTPGERGLYCGFDALPSLNYFGGRSAENVILSGYEGGLDISKVARRGVSKMASLDGLRGGVYHAKVLPWIDGEACHHYPLIALVIHGPAASETTSENGSMPSSELRLSEDTIQSSPRIPGRATLDAVVTTTQYYQTTVEVYSLSTKKRVTRLLTVPEIRAPPPRVGTVLRPPPPSGALSLHADQGTVVVSSGTTGESWVYRYDVASTLGPAFKCVCKIWTTFRETTVVEKTNGDFERQAGEAVPTAQATGMSILSLRGRYLAYCPPHPSSQKSLRAIIPELHSNARIPGLNSFAPPQLPQVNCLLDAPGGQSMLKGMAKTAMQELSKGAAYAGEMGLQYWNNYWNKSNSQTSPTSPYQTQSGTVYHFPPTHGATSQALPPAKDPGLVSILDLELLAKQASTSTSSPHSMATFKMPQGCSFMSLSPDGLKLFTASTKGDVQVIWDLKRMHYAKSSRLKSVAQSSEFYGPHVRQIAQFSRMTIARIVDVVWTSPHGECAAMVTEPGTVHVLDIPTTAFTWPPPRRRMFAADAQSEGSQSTSSNLTVSGAISSVWNTAKPFVGASHRRRSSAGISGVTAAGVKAQAGHGTQILVAGISRSVGAATGKMNEIRKSSGTRLHLPRHSSTSAIPSSGCVRFVKGSHNDFVFVLGGGIVRLYTIKSRTVDRTTEAAKVSRATKPNYIEYKLCALPEHKNSPDFLQDLEVDDFDLRGHESTIPHSQSVGLSATQQRTQEAEYSIPQAEIESNAPYQPFHADRRVGLHVYSVTEELDPPSPSVSALLSAPTQSVRLNSDNSKVWVFGGPISCIKLDVGPSRADNEEEPLSDHEPLPSSAFERTLKIGTGDEEGEQIVVTTRRRKGASRLDIGSSSGAADEEGFFEDDCEVLDFASQRV